MTSKKNTEWVVVNLTGDAVPTRYNVSDKETAHNVGKLLNMLGSAAHMYPKGYYPEFDLEGNFK